MQTQACAVYRLLLSRREQPGHDERFVLVRPLPRMLRNSDAMPFKAVLDAAPHAEHMHIRLELDIGLNQDRTWLLNVTHFNVSLYNVDEWVFQKSVFHLTFADGTGFSHRLLHHIPIAGVLLKKKMEQDRPVSKKLESKVRLDVSRWPHKWWPRKWWQPHKQIKSYETGARSDQTFAMRRFEGW